MDKAGRVVNVPPLGDAIFGRGDDPHLRILSRIMAISFPDFKALLCNTCTFNRIITVYRIMILLVFGYAFFYDWGLMIIYSYNFFSITVSTTIYLVVYISFSLTF